MVSQSVTPRKDTQVCCRGMAVCWEGVGPSLWGKAGPGLLPHRRNVLLLMSLLVPRVLRRCLEAERMPPKGPIRIKYHCLLTAGGGGHFQPWKTQSLILKKKILSLPSPQGSVGSKKPVTHFHFRFEKPQKRLRFFGARVGYLAPKPLSHYLKTNPPNPGCGRVRQWYGPDGIKGET